MRAAMSPHINNKKIGGEMSEEQNVEKVDYAGMLNLPKTSFKMKANLAQKEPITLRDWNKANIYEKSLKEDKGYFILHDGPPYANGNIHIGHALNKVLKDIILKYKRLRGYNAPYIPGWDTHGLPIEQALANAEGVDRKKLSIAEFRKLCAEYALRQVDNQRAEFKRLGVTGTWDNPYLTLQPEFEAEQIRVFGKMAENGYIYKGLKPRTAAAQWFRRKKTAM